MALSVSRLNQLFQLDNNGRLIALTQRGPIRAGQPVTGNPKGGYRSVMIDGKEHRLHRIIWTIHHQKQPAGHIGFVDGNPDNLHPGNLQQQTKTQTVLRNGLRSDNTTGHPGIRRHRSGRWGTRYRNKSYGTFPTRREAIERRQALIESIIKQEQQI